MFHSKKAQVDFKKVTQKFLDAKRESRQRANALRVLLDNFETHEAKVFFQRHYSEIYYICHDYFSIVEVNLRQKASKAVREDLDCVLYIFEKLLLLLPELVHERWQFASIGRTMLKLLHHGNAFKLRSEGIRLLILWLQALQENMDISCEVMFACVVPGFPNPLETLDTSTITVPAHVLEDICNFVRGGDGASSSGSMTLLPQGAKDGGEMTIMVKAELEIIARIGFLLEQECAQSQAPLTVRVHCRLPPFTRPTIVPSQLPARLLFRARYFFAPEGPVYMEPSYSANRVLALPGQKSDLFV